jgi:hypothetical protein
MFRLLLQPFVQQADDDNASWSRQGRRKCATNPGSILQMSVWDLATITARPPNRFNHKIELTIHADFKSVYKLKPS